MGILQQKKGSAWENEFAEILSRNGFWATVLPKQRDGSQPCDVVAGKNGTIYNFDCKTLKKGNFPLGRVEENQVRAFEKLMTCGCRNNYLAVKLDNGQMYLLDAWIAIDLKHSGIQAIDVREYGTPLVNWVVSGR